MRFDDSKESEHSKPMTYLSSAYVTDAELNLSKDIRGAHSNNQSSVNMDEKSKTDTQDDLIDEFSEKAIKIKEK